MTKFLAGLAVCAVSWLLCTYVVVGLVETVEDLWLPGIPTLSYPDALWITLLIGLVGTIRGLAGGIIRGMYREGDR